MSATRRLFFALWPIESLRTQLIAHTSVAIKTLPARAMAPDNLHITLAFIGSVPFERLNTLLEVGHVLQLQPCELILDRLAIWSRARVLVLCASTTPPQLQQLVVALQEKLRAEGFQFDQRPYRPHVTLARDIRAVESSEPATPLLWPARDFVLVESMSTPRGVHYEVLATFP